MTAEFIFVTGCTVVGMWLDGIGGKDTFMDRFLTPLPLFFSGLILVACERFWNAGL